MKHIKRAKELLRVFIWFNVTIDFYKLNYTALRRRNATGPEARILKRPKRGESQRSTP